jgi:hypothetical protein
MNRASLVDVKALVRLEYDGRIYRPGDWFKVRELDALTLGEAKRVSLNREYQTRATAVRVPASKSPKRNTYKRRDLTAESS